MANEFGVVLIAGLAIFGAAILVSHEFEEGFSAQDEEEVVLMEENPGQVGSAVRDFRRVEFGEVTVGDMRGDVQVLDELDRTTRNTWRSGSTIEAYHEGVDPTEGVVEFEVVGREGSGKLWVEVNGQRIYEERAEPGEEVSVRIPSENLEQGDNSVEIGNTLGSMLSSSEYRLRHVSVNVNDRKFHDYEGSFQVYDYELSDFVESEIQFDVSESVINNPLNVRVNGNNVYSENTPRGERNIELDRNHLNVGANRIAVSTGRESEYRLEGVSIVLRYIASAESTSVDIDFDLDDDEISKASSENTNLVLKFDYQNLMPDSREVEINLNDSNATLVPSSGSNEVIFDGSSLENENTLSFHSNGTYELENLQLISRKNSE